MDFRLPDIGEGIAEGEIVKWLVKEGDEVKEDQVIFEVMTDKATVEIPSPTTGKIKQILAKEGQVVPIETIVVIIDDGKETVSNKHHKIEEKNTNFVLIEEQKEKVKVLASPATRKFARDNNINISEVTPTGNNGKVTKEDIKNHINNKNKTKEVKELVVIEQPKYNYTKQANKENLDEERVPFRGLRKKISENLLRSKHNAPHFMIADEVDVTELVNFRKECKDLALKKGVKLTYLPFIIKAVVSALKDFPTLNSVLDEENSELILKKYYNIGVAVATNQGLIVPVLKNADKRSIFDSAKELDRLADNTRSGKIDIEDLRGGTFTVTNIGSIGGLFSSPIINYPEVAILAVNKIVEKPIVKDGNIVIRSMMYLSMSCDHRVVDGAIAALFLNRVIELIQNPKVLLLE
ncbi:MAG: dihydrolipoamide acetyltransferase family protein [Candidatus Sericytochromatia bacterium]